MDTTEPLDVDRSGTAAGMAPGQHERQPGAAADRARSQILRRAQAQHRLKTSLAVVNGWATTLDEHWERLSDERRREGVGIIRRATEAMADQTRMLLQDAQAEMLSLDAEPVRLDLCAVLDATTAAFTGISDGHVVEHETSGGRVEVDVDPAALQQVLGHLIENAVKYSPTDTRVGARAETDPDTGEVVLGVVDQGIGIPEDVDLFAAFWRGPDGGSTEGVGLGLYVVRNLVVAMGGTVSARRNPGGGSTFEVRLPGPHEDEQDDWHDRRADGP